MGPAPLSHSEMLAWQTNTGIELNAWESRSLRNLSIDYITASREAEDPECPAPWDEAPYYIEPASLVAKRMQAHIRRLTEL